MNFVPSVCVTQTLLCILETTHSRHKGAQSVGLMVDVHPGRSARAPPRFLRTLERSRLIATSATFGREEKGKAGGREQALTKGDVTVSGWRQHLSATLLHLRWWPSPRRTGELAAHSAVPPRAGLQRPLLRPRRGEGQRGVGFGCSCTDSFLGWGSAGSLMLHGLCSGCGEWGALPGCGARPSPCNGFSCHRLQ